MWLCSYCSNVQHINIFVFDIVLLADAYDIDHVGIRGKYFKQMRST